MTFITVENLLKKFDGNAELANAYVESLIMAKEELNKEFGPEGPVVKAILENQDREFAWDDLAWWKKLLVKSKLMKW